MNLTNQELQTLLEEITPFEINKGEDSITSYDFTHYFTPDIYLSTRVIMKRSFNNKIGYISFEEEEPVFNYAYLIDFDFTGVYFGEEITTNYQKEMIENYLRTIIS